MFTVTPPQPQASSTSSASQQAQQQQQHHYHHHQQHQQQQQQQQHQQLLLQQQLLQQQQAAIIQQAMLQQQAALYHPAALLAAMSQIEPIPSGYLPPGFDASSCCSVYVGNIHPNVTDKLLAEVFGTVGLLKGCKLIKKEKSSFGFVEYFDHRSAAAAIMTLNGREIFSQCIKVNWAYASGQKEDTTGHFSIFVGDLSSDVADATLLNAFSIYPSCSDARVMWDQRTGRSRGFGFVFFKNQQEAQRAIDEMSGKWLGSRVIRCNWATRSGSNSASQTEATHGLDGSATDPLQGSESFSQDAPENNPQFTTVYVGNLATEVNQVELYRLFHMLGAGAIEDVRVQRDKGFGFVRYRTHEEAALAIQLANGKIVYGKSIKCSWGNKPTVPGTSLTSQQPAPAGSFQGMANTGLGQGYTAADLMDYEKQLSQALLPVPGQQGTSIPLGGGAGLGTRAGYGSF